MAMNPSLWGDIAFPKQGSCEEWLGLKEPLREDVHRGQTQINAGEACKLRDKNLIICQPFSMGT